MSDPVENTERPQGRSRVPLGFRGALVVAFALVAFAIAWTWYQSRADMSGLRDEVAKNLRATDSESRDARVAARQAQEAVREDRSRLAQLEGKLAESQSQQLALEALYQELSRSRDEWVLAEIEQIVAIASQQLQLAGNVQAALVALQTAEAQLARSDRPQFFALRKALGRDIERLKAAPNVDTVGLALKLDEVIAAVDSLPLFSDQRVAAAAGETREEDFWTRLRIGIWDEIRQLVRIRNIEQPEPPLLAPTQGYFLRENLRLRLLNARLALLNHNEALFRADLQAALDWFSRYFDAHSKQVVLTAANLKQLSSSGISIELPRIDDTIAALRNFKALKDRTAK
jgi:uroporphyrin-III C-methyltransferase